MDFNAVSTVQKCGLRIPVLGIITLFIHLKPNKDALSTRKGKSNVWPI